MKNILTAFIVTGISVLTNSSIDAALPPLYQSLSEYKSLLNSQELDNKLTPAETIHNIERTDKGFIITTTAHYLNIDIVYDPQEHPGPAKFHFIFHTLRPINESNP